MSERMTKDEVERGYNNRAAVPDHPQHFAKYAAWSQAARDEYAPKVNLRYGPNPRELLDLFLPASTPRGTYLYIHGGYWRALSKEDYSFVAGPFVDQGIAVAVMDYDLCPQVSIATIVDECRRAVRWLAQEGPKHGVGGPLVVGGSSAGGHLAAMMFATDWAAQGLAASPLAGGVSISGVHDLRPLVDFSYNVDLGLDDAEAWRLSPLAYRSLTAAPFVIACGAGETTEFLRQSQVLWHAWADVRRPLDGPLFIPGRDHFTIQLDHADPGSDLTVATLALF
jgi:arylformamidase